MAVDRGLTQAGCSSVSVWYSYQMIFETGPVDPSLPRIVYGDVLFDRRRRGDTHEEMMWVGFEDRGCRETGCAGLGTEWSERGLPGAHAQGILV